MLMPSLSLFPNACADPIYQNKNSQGWIIFGSGEGEMGRRERSKIGKWQKEKEIVFPKNCATKGQVKVYTHVCIRCITTSSCRPSTIHGSPVLLKHLRYEVERIVFPVYSLPLLSCGHGISWISKAKYTEEAKSRKTHSSGRTCCKSSSKVGSHHRPWNPGRKPWRCYRHSW